MTANLWLVLPHFKLELLTLKYYNIMFKEPLLVVGQYRVFKGLCWSFKEQNSWWPICNRSDKMHYNCIQLIHLKNKYKISASALSLSRSTLLLAVRVVAVYYIKKKLQAWLTFFQSILPRLPALKLSVPASRNICQSLWSNKLTPKI